MEITDKINEAFKEIILPELGKLTQDVKEIKTTLSFTNQRITDIHSQYLDLSRRLDSARMELTERIDETNKRIDETNRRMNRLYEVIVRREEHASVVERGNHIEIELEAVKKKIAMV